MKAITTKEIIATINKVSPKKTSLPILENIVLDGKHLIATDLEVSVKIPYGKKSQYCVPSQKLAVIVDTNLLLMPVRLND